MNKENTILNQEALLSEYQQIRGEIDGYFKLRITVLAIVVSALGVILGTSAKIDTSHQVLALYIIVIIGTLLTYSYTILARQRSSYLKVFVEGKIKELKWFTVISEKPDQIPYFMEIIFNKLKIPIDLFPHEYPFIYLILSIIINFISIPSSGFNFNDTIFLIIIFGDVLLLVGIGFLQYAISYKKFKLLEDYYKKSFSQYID